MSVRPGMLGFVVAVTAAILSDPLYAEVKVDPALPQYKAVQGVAGELKIIGSDTMKHEMGLLTESFTKLYPDVRPEIEGKGSATAPPALLAGAAHFRSYEPGHESQGG